MTDKCDVCEGRGVYPIFNRYGQELYEIECPECFGDGTAVAEQPADETQAPPPPDGGGAT